MEGITEVERNHNSRETGDFDIVVGGRLRALRLLYGLTQSELAKKLGVTAQQIQKYENGRNRISAARLWQVAKMVDMPASYFFDVSGEEVESARKSREEQPATRSRGRRVHSMSDSALTQKALQALAMVENKQTPLVSRSSERATIAQEVDQQSHAQILRALEAFCEIKSPTSRQKLLQIISILASQENGQEDSHLSDHNG